MHTRRSALKTLAAATAFPLFVRNAQAADEAPPFKLGTVTYNLAKDWDVATIIKNCEATGFEAVELRTTHKHGVEPSLDKAARAEVRKRFADSRRQAFTIRRLCKR